MVSVRRIVGVMTLGLTIAGCASQFNTAIMKLDSTWKEQNDQVLAKDGHRTFQIARRQAFTAVQAAIQRLGMVIERQDYHTGFLFVSAPAPTPLTVAEWTVVQESDTPKMRAIIEEEVGALSWFAKLDPSNRDVLANVFVTDKDEGVEVSLNYRIRDRNPASRRAKRMQAPPTAVRIGLRKFWSVFEGELAAVVKHRVAAEESSVASRTAESPTAASVASKSPSGIRAKNPDGVAVIIGNKRYPGRVPDVDFAHNDADAIKRFVVDSLGFQEGNVIDLRDATQAEMMAVFGNNKTHKGKLWRWVRPRESDVVVFYAGHGVPGQKDGRAYLLPVNAEPEAPEMHGYPLDLLYANLIKLEARSVTVFLDAGFSGDSPGGLLLQATSEVSVMPKVSVASEFSMLSATQGNQVASWDEEAQHGLFTRYLLEALHGAADGALYGDGDGKVTVNEIKSYLDREMTYAARRRYGREQMVTAAGELKRVLVNTSGRVVDKQ